MNGCKNELEMVKPVELFKKDPEIGVDDLMFDLNTPLPSIQDSPKRIQNDFLSSLVMMKGTKLNLLLIFAPIAYIGTKSGYLGEFICFCFAGLALIPCAER